MVGSLRTTLCIGSTHDLVPAEGGVGVAPVAVEDAQVAEGLAQALLRDGALVLLQLDAGDTSRLRLAVRDTAVHGALAATTADADAEDDVPGLGLVAEGAGLLRARRAAQAHDGVLVAVLPRAHALHEAHHV